MEFKFRAVDSRPENSCPTSSSSSPSPSSSFNPTTGQALRPNRNFNRNMLQSVQRELEKQQIREEIMASEIARRRILEAEVRMELMAEREMAAMHRVWNRGLYFEQRATMRFDSRRPVIDQFDNVQQWRCESLPPPPPQRMLSPPKLPLLATEVLDTEVNGKPEGNNDKLIILDKPDPNCVVGAKRKTPPPIGARELPMPLISLKKLNEEWSCAICQISATSEKGLMEHLQGKKHKAKEARLREQRMKNISTTNLLDKSPPRKHAKVAEETVDDSDKKLDDREKLENKKDEILVKEKKRTKKPGKMLDIFENLKNLEPAAVDEVERTAESTLKKKHKTFCCEICGVVAHSEVVMENHKMGKKHIARLHKLDKKDKVDNTLALLGGNQMPKDINVMANECKEKLVDVPTISPTNTVNEQSSLVGIQMVKETDLMTNEANEKLTCVLATSATNTVNEQSSLDGIQMAKETDLTANEANEKLICVPATCPTNTVNEQSSLDGIQMAKETDETANEANEKLLCVPATSATNTINERASLDVVQMAKDNTLLANEANESW